MTLQAVASLSFTSFLSSPASHSEHWCFPNLVTLSREVWQLITDCTDPKMKHGGMHISSVNKWRQNAPSQTIIQDVALYGSCIKLSSELSPIIMCVKHTAAVLFAFHFASVSHSWVTPACSKTHRRSASSGGGGPESFHLLGGCIYIFEGVNSVIFSRWL